MDSLEILHIGFHEALVRGRLLIDAQEVNADIALLIRVAPTLHSSINLQLRQFIPANGIEAHHMVIAKACRQFLHAILRIELKLGNAFNKAQIDISFLHAVHSGLQGLVGSQNLGTRVDDF